MMNHSSKTPTNITSPNSVYEHGKTKNSESESGLALLARLGTRPSLKNMDPQLLPSGAQPCDVIEVTGKKGSGKSLVILHFIVNVLLPESWCGIHVAGSGGGIVFIDTDMHFSILQIENMIQRRIKKIIKTAVSALKSSGKEGEGERGIVLDPTEFQNFFHSGKKNQIDEINRLTRDCMKNLLYLKCTDSFQFVVTLLSIDELVQNKDYLSLIVIDSISAFYWFDRTYKSENCYKLEQHYNKIFKVFLGHIRKHKLVLLASRQSLFYRRFARDEQKVYCQNDDIESVDDGTEYEYMGREWYNSLTTRILISIDKQTSGTSVPRELESKDKADNSFDGIQKSDGERTVYSAEVNISNKKRKVMFTIHEDGVRPLTVKT